MLKYKPLITNIATTKNGDENKEMIFLRRGFWDNLDDF